MDVKITVKLRLAFRFMMLLCRVLTQLNEPTGMKLTSWFIDDVSNNINRYCKITT